MTREGVRKEEELVDEGERSEGEFYDDFITGVE